MAIDNIPLTVSENTQEVVLEIDDTSHPYYVGARAYVTQIPQGAIVTVIDKFGKTEATLLDGNYGNITDITYDPETKTLTKVNGVVLEDLITLSEVAISNDYEDLDNTPYVETSYYDEVTVTKERYYDTDCYIAVIPVEDNDGNLIKPYVGHNDEYSPLQYAQKNGTSLTTNNCIAMKKSGGGSARGNIIGAGEVLNSQDIVDELVPNKVGYLTISEDRQVIKTYPITTSLSVLTADDDVYNCMTYYYPLVENGEIVDNSATICNEAGVATDKHPRLAIGVTDDKTIVLLACDGRTDINAGLTSDELASVLVQKDCVDAWNLDGGGSTSMSVRGSKINRNVDENGTEDRPIRYTFNVKKPTAQELVTGIFEKIGVEKQLLIQQLVPMVNNYAETATDKIDEINSRFAVITSANLNNVAYTYFGYVTRATNSPYNSQTNGYLINIVRANDTSYRYQIFIHYANQSLIYHRICSGGTWTPWRLMQDFLSSSDSIDIATRNYVGTVIGDYVYFTAPIDFLWNAADTDISVTWQSGGGVTIRCDGNVLLDSDNTPAVPSNVVVRQGQHTGVQFRFTFTGLSSDPNYKDNTVVGLQVQKMHIAAN